MACIDFVSGIHKKTKRDYLERVVKHDKPRCAEIARKFGPEYWDGDRRYGYGGFTYDGRWAPVAGELVGHYGLKPGMRVLDVGCGKAFLLYDMAQAVPGLRCEGLDVSRYAVDNAKEEMRPFLKQGTATCLPYEDKAFDLVLSLNTLHNLYLPDLKKALGEITRVSKGNAYVVVESYRNEQEKADLLYWQLTCECFFTPAEWEWLFKEFGYGGDYSFIFFE